jgi:two-component system NtrC family sensor kinase
MILRSLKTRILASFLLVIFTMTLLIAFVGYSIIQKDIINTVQHRVTNTLDGAQKYYNTEIEKIGESFKLVTFGGDINSLKEKMGVHYLKVVDKTQLNSVKDEIVLEAFAKKVPISGTRIIGKYELEQMNGELEKIAKIEIKPTPMARQTQLKVLEGAMAKEFAKPFLDKNGDVEKVYYGGRIINRDYAFVDKLRDLVFGSELYKSKPVGTVTIFQGDTRISTNVLDEKGERAVGTRVSEQVYKKVFEENTIWHSKAFVVTDWYYSAYKPIKNIKGETIGILYVGLLEKPYTDMQRQNSLILMGIVAAATTIAVLLSLVLASLITKPIRHLLDATRKLSSGELGYKVKIETEIAELETLTHEFNEMSAKLDEREDKLHESNEKLSASNKSYIDLIGFVSHELKGILASAIINTYAVRDGLLGMINFKQRKAIDSVTRNLDYLEAVVKKFLSLGRIERGDLEVNKVSVLLKKLFDESVVSLAAVTAHKNIILSNNIDENLRVNADIDLLLVVANNLVSNAIKYGKENGVINITSAENGNNVEIEVYNDSIPIAQEQIDKLFKKFSRLDNAQTKKVKGTGLGLFITKQIIERHGGTIWVKPKEQGNSFIFQIERGI